MYGSTKSALDICIRMDYVQKGTFSNYQQHKIRNYTRSLKEIMLTLSIK